MTSRRITSVIMVLALVCSLMVVYTPRIANAMEPAEEENCYMEELQQTEYTSGDYKYEVHKDDHSVCTITKYNGTSSNVIIPTSLDGKTVVDLGWSVFQNNKSVQSVYIPDTVKTMSGESQFRNCTSLTSIRFPEGLKRIPTCCFQGCDSLSTITIPESVEEIGNNAFFSCKSLKNVTIGSRVRKMDSICFGDCDSLQSITLPKSMFLENSVGHSIFSGSDSLESITIENGGNTIPENIFKNCTVESITLPNSIEYINVWAFENCKKLKTIKMGSNVKMINSYAFYNATDIKDFYNYSMDTKYPDGLFDDSVFVTLHGLKGSTTEAYASQYNIPFVPLPDTAMLRMYNPYSGEHLYTSDQNEKEYLQISGWNYEGLAWIESSKAKTPVYRFYNPLSGEHHYTMDEGEKDYLAGIGWNYEGVGWKSTDAGTPVYRLFNPNNPGPAAHHYTTDAYERSVLISNGWNDEGIGWYGL